MLIASEEEKELLRLKRDTAHIKTSLKWANEHKGFRPGCVHVILGTTHSGKSTLVRTIIYDYFKNNDVGFCAVWLSEESVEDFNLASIDIEWPQRAFACLDIYSEFDCSSKKEMKKKLVKIFEETRPDLLIIDNLTTSELYESVELNEAKSLLAELKKLAHKYNTALIIVTHTRSEISDYNGKIIDVNDVRGLKSLSNIAQFFYILQVFKRNGTSYVTLRLAKVRNYGGKITNVFWELIFNKKTETLDNSYFIDFRTFKENYKASDKL